jgi:putative membrane protein
MTVAVFVLAAAGLYAWGLVRVARAHRPFPRFAPWGFAAGLAAIVASLEGPLDGLADISLSWHMVQHLGLIAVSAPLLLLGAPLRLALAALPPRAAGRLARVLGSPVVRAFGHPVFGLGALTVVLYGTHFSPLYEGALENESVHAAEHTLYLAAALAYWNPIFAVAPAPHAPAHPVRILALFLSLPMSAFLGFAFYATRHVLYAHYATRPDALADQVNAGTVMWLSSGTPVLLALLWVVADWGARERRIGAAFDAVEDAG